MLWVRSGPGDLTFITWSADSNVADAGESVHHAYSEIGQRLREDDLVILHERVFSDVTSAPSIVEWRVAALGEDSDHVVIPPTRVEGAPCSGSGVAGIHLIAARPAAAGSSEVIEWHGTPCGRRVDGEDASYLALSDLARLLPTEAPSQPADETRETLLLAQEILRGHDWSFADVNRTWFYLENILNWYDDFNLARTAVYETFGLLDHSPSSIIPASTGIGGGNARGHRCTLDLLAMQPLAGRELSVKRLRNPLQNEAPEYGSSFSRGLNVATDRCRYLLISGTASIDEHGNTVHPGDFDCQVRRTLDNIESLLASAGAVFDDICQGSAFVRRPEDVERLNRILQLRGLGSLPLVSTIEDICRDDLLFELDATAVIARPAAGK